MNIWLTPILAEKCGWNPLFSGVWGGVYNNPGSSQMCQTPLYKRKILSMQSNVSGALFRAVALLGNLISMK